MDTERYVVLSRNIIFMSHGHAEALDSTQTLNTVLWLLLQHGKVNIKQNPHFYSSKDLEKPHDHDYMVSPIQLGERLGKSLKKMHVLVDLDRCMVVRSQAGASFYRNFGNIWMPGQFKIVKGWWFFISIVHQIFMSCQTLMGPWRQRQELIER